MEIMTLDEAIAQAREKADKDGTCWVHCTSIRDCKKCEQEHKQLAEWLEELKDLREMRDAIESNANTLEQNGYNKAIDDFVNSCKENTMCKTFGLRENDIEKIAEQLKEGESCENN